MESSIVLDESAMTALESHIPELAEEAVRRAYLQALTREGQVIEAIDGNLVATSVDGSQKIIRPLDNKPTRVPQGARRVRKGAT
jgi:hypothetical protein